MINYRITKYNPEKRDKNGRFLDKSEWTSFYDIGQPNFKNFTFKEYEIVESNYVEAIKIILDEKGVHKLKVDSLENHRSENSFKDSDKNALKFKNGLELNRKNIEEAIRFILREQVWMNLIAPKIKVTFGYDYYMYVECETLQQNTIQKIRDLDLFLD